ncbi:MAG TPA: maleylpyruvate isomerase family mycothiol-dependent enzyme [Sporichthyaceae bacterium]|jgi:maleylpyruvate isomerase|nr:maleylpyruvate isomerase family mycothiol-dependent enzyme [Sporichthyaceae bacterium]
MTQVLDAVGVALAVDEIDIASDRLLDAVSALTDEALRGPSRLPGWTRGHLVTHVARNAEALLNLLHTAATGQLRPMYPSMAARNDAIEAGAGRGADEITQDLAVAAAEFSDAARSLPLEKWNHEVTLLSGRVVRARWLLPGRMREVEFHHVDLGGGYTTADWDLGFVRACLDEYVASMSGRAGMPDLTLRATDGRSPDVWAVHGVGTAQLVTGPRAALLAWICGRSNGEGLQAGDDGLPELPPWP